MKGLETLFKTHEQELFEIGEKHFNSNCLQSVRKSIVSDRERLYINYIIDKDKYIEDKEMLVVNPEYYGELFQDVTNLLGQYMDHFNISVQCSYMGKDKATGESVVFNFVHQHLSKAYTLDT